MPLPTDRADNDPGHTAAHNATNTEVNRIAAGGLSYTEAFQYNLNDVANGMTFVFGDAQNRPAGFFHTLVETFETPAGKYQRATEFYGGQFAIRCREGNGNWTPWKVYKPIP